MGNPIHLMCFICLFSSVLICNGDRSLIHKFTDNAGLNVCFCKYFSVGKLWTRSQKLAYTLLNKLSTRNEPLLRPGDRVRVLIMHIHIHLHLSYVKC